MQFLKVLGGLALKLPDFASESTIFQEVPADADKQCDFFATQKYGKTTGGSSGKRNYRPPRPKKYNWDLRFLFL